MLILATLVALSSHDAHAQLFGQKQDTPQALVKNKPAQDTSLNSLHDAPPASVLACAGPLAKDTSHARLIGEFGERNVVFKDVAEGINKQATVIFDDDPTRRVVI